MATPIHDRTPPLYHAVDVAPAVAAFAAAVATFIAIGMATGASTFGLIAAQIAGFAAIPLYVTWKMTGSLRALGVHPPRALAAIGAVLVGATLWYVNLRATTPIIDALDRERDVVDLGERMIGRRSIGELIAVVVILPAVCEELLNRGLLARSLATRLPAIAAALISAAAFSALHFSIARAFPTFTLGVVLGLIAIRTSTWLAIAVHGLNNAMAIAALEIQGLATTIDDHATISLICAATISAIGLFLVFRKPISTPT